jgi:hypothetical protein
MSFTSSSTALLTLGASTASASARVLLLADENGSSTTALANSIATAGFLVTVRPAPEYTWDGTDPSLDGYDLVIHLNGNTFSEGQTLSATAQTALVNFVNAGGGFIGSQWSGLEALGEQALMQDLVLLGFPGQENENCISCEMRYTAVLAQQDHPVLAGIPSPFFFMADGHAGGPLIDFGTSPSTVLMELPSTAPGVAVRNLGQGKVVNFSFAANYGLGSEGVGPGMLENATIQQLYVNAVRWAARAAAAPTKAPATINIGYLEATFDGTAKGVSVTTNPAGLTGLTVTYSQAGVPVEPVNAGSYQVLVTLDHPDFEAPQATGTFSIQPAKPVIQWSPPTTLPYGTRLGPAEMNASAFGVNGTVLVGRFVYLPNEETVLQAGTQPLSVEFLPNDANYTTAIKTVMVTVLAGRALKFRGFFRPVHNLPSVNRVKAGRVIPVQFAVEGAGGSPVLQGSPTSAAVACDVAAPEKSLGGSGSGKDLRLLRGENRYTYSWRTTTAWAGSCRKLVVTLVDGSKHEALFRFERDAKRNDSVRGLSRPSGTTSGSSNRSARGR